MTKGKRNSAVDTNRRAVSSRFAVAIRTARQDKGLSLQELGEATSTSASYINRLEKYQRKNPSITVLIALAQELDINIFKLFKLAVEDEVNEAPDITDLILYDNFSINGSVVNDSELRKVLRDLIHMIVYKFDENVDYRDVVSLLDLIKEFHLEKKEMSEEGA